MVTQIYNGWLRKRKREGVCMERAQEQKQKREKRKKTRQGGEKKEKKKKEN
jgi:hypothetical protein